MSLAKVTPFKRPTRPQLPVSWYVDPEIYALEQKVLFPHAPKYIGHELMVPNPGDYQSLEWMNHGKALVRNAHGIELISNICRHRQAIMLKGKGTAHNIVCPIHRWTYDLQGELMGAPHFEEKPCLHLGKTPLQNWNGLLFEGERSVAGDLSKLGFLKDFDFSGFMLDRVMIDEYNFNWKTFIEVYLEDYHVEPFHPGLGNFVDCSDLKWEFGEWYSVQSVGVNRNLQKSGSPIYRQWQEQVLQYNNGNAPKYGAIWLVYYPFLMLEWYPHVLVVSHIIPRGPMPAPMSSSSIIPRTSRCSSANSSKRNRPPTRKPQSRTRTSASACTKAAWPCSNKAGMNTAPTSTPWKPGWSTSICGSKHSSNRTFKHFRLTNFRVRTEPGILQSL